MRRRELADDYASRGAAGIMTCGETYFMALRQRAGTGRPTPPIPAKLKEKEPKKIMMLELKDQIENGPA